VTLGRERKLAIAGAVFVVLLVYGTTTIDGFTSEANIASMLVLAAFLGIACIGQTLAPLIGGIDLSIPFVIGMANVALAELAGHRGWPGGLAIAFILVVAALVGLVNAALTWYLGVNPLIVTLGVGFTIQGGVQIITSGTVEGAAPQWLTDLTSVDRHVLGLPIPPVVLVWAVAAAVVVVALRRTRFGRHVYAVGGNPLAADRVLIRRRNVTFAVYAISAVGAAAAGVLLGGFTGGGFVDVGNPYLFTTIAAVVIGGTSLMGGEGGYGLTVLGVCVLTVLTTVLVGEGLEGPAQQAVLGGLIVAMVCLYGREPHPRTQI
jgi:ribose transport system permease protein